MIDCSMPREAKESVQYPGYEDSIILYPSVQPLITLIVQQDHFSTRHISTPLPESLPSLSLSFYIRRRFALTHRQPFPQIPDYSHNSDFTQFFLPASQAHTSSLSLPRSYLSTWRIWSLANLHRADPKKILPCQYSTTGLCGVEHLAE